jgi:hypothetical protein
LPYLDPNLSGVRIALAPRHQQQYQPGIPRGIANVRLCSDFPPAPDGQGHLCRVTISNARQGDDGNLRTGGTPQALDEIIHASSGIGLNH